MSIMKWTSKRTGDNIDLEFSRPGKQATDYVDRSIQPTLIRQALGKEAQRKEEGFGKVIGFAGGRGQDSDGSKCSLDCPFGPAG